jgi:DNA-binding NarL/FixJ family response regulator
MSKISPHRILIVDDHPVCRIGLQSLLEREPDLSVDGEAEDAAEALAALRRVPVDLVIVDLILKGSSGLELVKLIKAELPRLPILLISIHDEALFAERALRAGATGYVRKDASGEQIIEAVRRTLQGQLVVSDDISGNLLRRLNVGRTPAPPESGASGTDPVSPPLTDREIEILQLLGQGLSTRQCAEQLHLSLKTVETHQAHLKEKLGLRDANQLRRYAAVWLDRTSANRPPGANRNGI